LVRFDAGSELGFLLGKHAYDASSDFVMNDCLVVFTDDVNSEFLEKETSIRTQNAAAYRGGGGGD
jgi:hypothetical protein